ncbi:DOPA 4,5-dioxygenase family protein [Marinomonas sp. 15G1-11]|uniref:DOPA 4,5-dioxygenase family protein n=1 Tax=Marinomonas phaeophyticola TaxID=3004091 RepID=A0ABT4JSP3_9GAMM|nr:DOPA 4,5-dioxygenase family protein [Marinomonas sp. 15G1-11]MCZ2721403.1 DOPA 4,5-dioxygenase family protein [Marinomonas sp. 15G1-11]
MTTIQVDNITAYHAHLYFHDMESMEAAVLIADAAQAAFPIKVGRFHQRPVGPHPVWSCQLSFAASTFGDFIPWLMMNRGNTDVFLHPLTGDDYLDHTQGASWLGHSYPLKLDMFRPS